MWSLAQVVNWADSRLVLHMNHAKSLSFIELWKAREPSFPTESLIHICRRRQTEREMKTTRQSREIFSRLKTETVPCKTLTDKSMLLFHSQKYDQSHVPPNAWISFTPVFCNFLNWLYLVCYSFQNALLWVHTDARETSVHCWKFLTQKITPFTIPPPSMWRSKDGLLWERDLLHFHALPV